MKYSTPELVVLGRADVVVLGQAQIGRVDSPETLTKPNDGIVLGLDD